MSDIFISYASADRERARLLADALANKGWSVWWDRTIPPGKEFDQVIEEALDAAKCVVVLWSKTSTASSWVKTEAAEAMRRKILVPALIDETKIPLEFRRLQAADLSQWQGELSHPELEKFSRSIEANINSMVEPVPDAKPSPQLPPMRPQPAEPTRPLYTHGERPAAKSQTKWVALGVVAMVALLGGGYFFYLEHSKRVELEERIAREKQEQAERERIAKEEAARAAALRKAEDDRRAADRAAQAKAAQEQERAAKAKAAQQQAEADRVALERQQRLASAPKSMNLDWNDNAIRYSGTLSWTNADASLRFTAYDARTGTRIGNYTLPAQVPAQGIKYVVSGSISVSGDSVSPYPHEHSINLYFNIGQGDGSLRFVQNCPRPGECYPGR